MKNRMLDSILQSGLRWASANSLSYIEVGGTCCPQEVLNCTGSRYDLERFGCLPAPSPSQADLLIISGAINEKLKPIVLDLYAQMAEPKFVIAVGACACKGGFFAGDKSSQFIKGGISEFLPVDVFVPGCPPRPEAIMNGILTLQDKIKSELGVERRRS